MTACLCSDHLFYLNYAITLVNNDEIERATEMYHKFEAIFKDLDESAKNSDLEVLEQRQALATVLAST